MEIKGAVALITGAGSGIGRATAQRLSRDGASVAVNDIDEQSARETVRLIERGGGRATPIPADVANDGDVRRMIFGARERYTRHQRARCTAGHTARSRRHAPAGRRRDH